MRPSIAAILAVCVCSSKAAIIGVLAPETIRIGSVADLKIWTGSVKPRADDVAVAFGWSPRGSAVEGNIGNLLRYTYLGPYESSLGLFNISIPVRFPADIPKGEGVISASIFSLLHDQNVANLRNFQINVTFDYKTTSPNYVFQ
ncbi:hypothetical protein V2G26_011326 [Clonostachys chloroleuca]|uniref:Uncharacterized protein n=1 Tax=Clonostachys chloroleuca TaxID=1926264 RepID=A0AA35PXL7_9HYPO|nr:unnamed protein product [Clonostachys chloroleuca]